VDYLKIAEDAMRVFDNHYDYEIDLLNRNKVMPVLIAKSGKDRNAAFDEDDLAHMFFYLETSNSIPKDAVLAMPHGCPFQTERAKCVYDWGLNTSHHSGHVVLYDAAQVDAFRSAAAFNIKW
jgi:hypothetical protein